MSEITESIGHVCPESKSIHVDNKLSVEESWSLYLFQLESFTTCKHDPVVTRILNYEIDYNDFRKMTD